MNRTNEAAFETDPRRPVDTAWKTTLWQQFGAAIDMLENALLACPDELWGDRSRQPEFWYLVYHTLFYLDLNLSGSVEGFAPPAPFNLDDLEPVGLMPEQAVVLYGGFAAAGIQEDGDVSRGWTQPGADYLSRFDGGMAKG